jgi:hypothetical protein
MYHVFKLTSMDDVTSYFACTQLRYIICSTETNKPNEALFPFVTLPFITCTMYVSFTKKRIKKKDAWVKKVIRYQGGIFQPDSYEL